jgi:hypothetical protein
LNYRWDSTSQAQNYKKYIHAGGNNILMEYFNWDGMSDWNISGKEEFAYDSDGNDTLEITSYFDEIDSTWIYNSKDVYGYDANVNQTLSIYSTWSVSSDLWISVRRNDYTYDESNNKRGYQ